MREFTGFKKGVNLGGWLSQCGAENYNDKHYSEYITERDIKKIAAIGADHIRLPIDYNILMTDDGQFIASGFEYVDKCIDYCRDNALGIVLDLHKTAGFVFDNKNYCAFFESGALQELFFKLWRELARRYGGKSDIAFELLNEITELGMAGKWNNIAARAIAEIRAYTKETKLIIGGIYNSSIYGLTLLDRPSDENIVFTFHCYSPMIFTHQQAYWVEQMPQDYVCAYPINETTAYSRSHEIFGDAYDAEFDCTNHCNLSSAYFERMFNSAAEIAKKYDVPLYCGEYGVIDRAEPQSTLNWFSDINAAFEKLGIARCVWNYKGKDYGITDEHYSGIINKLVDLL